MSQGANAVRNGKIFEEMTEPIFKRNGYEIFSGSDAARRPNMLTGHEKYVLTDVPYTNIFGMESRCGMRIVNTKTGKAVRVCTQYQEMSGGAYRKIPYLLLNAAKAFPEKEIVFVLDGAGMPDEVIKWVRQQAKSDLFDRESGGKALLVMSMKGFTRYFNKYFREDTPDEEKPAKKRGKGKKEKKNELSEDKRS